VPDVFIREGLRADNSAILGYPPPRGCISGLHLGPDAWIRSGSTIYNGSQIGARFETGHNVVVREDCLIGDDVSIWSNSVVDYGCRIGNGVQIHSNCYIAHYTEIDDDAILAAGVCVANDLSPAQARSADVISGPYIGAGAQLGVNVTLLPFVRIGAGSLIGAGAVVVADVPPGSIAFGNPAAIRGRVEDAGAIERGVAPVPDSAGRDRRSGRSTVTRLRERSDEA
jgi:acetyltransferase-like isoleucine patch superfamily enzyme